MTSKRKGSMSTYRLWHHFGLGKYRPQHRRKGQTGIYAFISAVILLAGVIYSFWATGERDRRNRDLQLQRTRQLAAAINPEVVMALAGDSSDLLRPEYHRLRDEIQIIGRAFPELHSICLVGCRANGELFYYLDNRPSDSPQHCPPGTVLADPNQAVVNACHNGTELVTEPHNGGDETWIGCLVPIVDPQDGLTVCTLGVKVKTLTWHLHILRAALPITLLCLLLIAMLLTAWQLQAKRLHYSSRYPLWLNKLEVILAIAMGIALSTFIAWHVRDLEEQQRLQAFRQLASNYTNAIARKLSYDDFTELAGMADFIASSDVVSKDEFETYTSHLVKRSMVRLWGWVDVVKQEERKDYEEQRQRAGPRNFAIVEPGPGRQILAAQTRNDYYPIVYFVPHEGNELASGFDMGYEPRRRAAIEEAIRTQLPTASAPVYHGFKPDEFKGFTIFHPVFAADNGPRLRGFATAAIRVEALFGHERQKHEFMELSFAYLHPDATSEQLLSRGDVAAVSDDYFRVRTLLVFGKVYTITARPTTAFIAAHPIWKAWLVWLTGLAFTCCIAIIVHMLCHRRHELENMVADRTHQLGITELRLNQLLAQSNTVLWECAADGRFTFISPVARAIYGRSPEELVGKHFFYSLHPPDGYERFKAQSEDLFASKKPFFDIVNPILKPSGEIIMVSTCGMPLFNDHGELTGYYGWDHNVTERVKISEQLKKSQLAAETANRAKSEFLINMSHDIRTPINGIVGCSELLKSSGLNDEQHDYTDIITASSQQLLILVNEILDFSRIETGRLELQEEEFNLRTMLEELCSNLALAINNNALELVSVIPQNLPVLLRGDAFHLQQIIMNLVNNAIKFTERGEVVISVTSSQETNAAVTLEFVVSDSGVGIEKKHQQRIFDMFYQGDSSMKRRYGGAGLGLSIVKNLVDLMKGSISFSSEPGQGARFVIHVNLMKQQPAIPPLEPLPDVLVDQSVLIVVSNDHARLALQDCLSARGLAATGVADMTAATRALAEARPSIHPFHIVIIDCQYLAEYDDNDDNPSTSTPWHDVSLVVLCRLQERHKIQQFFKPHTQQVLAKPVRCHELWQALLNAAGQLNCVRPVNAGKPTSAPKPASSPEPRADDVPSPVPQPASTASILLVEDNVVNQKVALAIMKKIGYSADVAANGLDAINCLKQKHYALVFMDIQMPEMDGLEATRLIRNPNTNVLDHDVVIIAMTAHAVQGYKESCLSSGMNDYVTKPITPEQIRTTIERWLR